MNKFLLIPVLIICCNTVFAKPVDVQKAKIVANHFMTGKLDEANMDLDLASSYGEPRTVFYIFNINQNKGFVIVAADDVIMPVLGYSTEGAFVTTNISPQVNYWLEGYKGQIEYATEHGMKAVPKIATQWTNLLLGPPTTGNTAQKTTTVSPLLTTKWDQMPYYNKFCPVPGWNYSSTPSGCVATAMAQIMNYWQYPAQGTGSHTYNSSSIGGALNANFGATTYDWASMPNALNASSTTAEIDAVATLMFHCGVAVDMDYNIAGGVGSGAYVIDYNNYPNQPCSENAFKDYFGYKSSILGLERQDYSAATWISMLKNELDNGRPILYTGFGNLGGHAFDFDGYDNNDMFHINWGWSGNSDGYFTIDNLAPAALGVGGGNGNFNNYQEALIGIEPANALSDLVINSQIVASTVSIDFGAPYTVSTSIKNAGNTDFTDGTLYLIAADTTDPDNIQVIMDTVHTSIASGGSYSFDFSTPGMSNLTSATYYITYSYLENGETSLHPVNDGVVANGSKLLTVLHPNGIAQTGSAAGYSIYPNPAKDMLHISLKDGSDQLKSVALYDIQGKEVMKQNLSSNSLDIPVNHYANGIYILKLHSDKGLITQKINIRK